MNLICFPHYTCGGLLCDILNESWSDVCANGGINSISHQLGKIGDADTVLTNIDQQTFDQQLQIINAQSFEWIGTHCWPGNLDLSAVNSTVVITTTTFRSKLYRWMRAYHLYFSKSDPWRGLHSQEQIDKQRETAKNYLVPFDPVLKSNVINIEFAEVVENSKQFKDLTKDKPVEKHISRWQNINSFLYDPDLWNSIPVRRFYEAELEANLDQYYVYQ
jgi:hypothetical protein